MRFTWLWMVMIFGLWIQAQAHEGAHGPPVSDAGKYGGLVAPVIDAKEANRKGAHPVLLYKAELVRSSDGTVRVYLYDSEMKPLPVSKWTTVRGTIGARVKGKVQTLAFELKAEGVSFIGKAPKAPSHPFSLDFHLTEADRVVFASFDNLD